MPEQSDNIQITTTNFRGRTVFTSEYSYYDKKYSWEAKAFIAHCISQWGDQYEHVLDFWEKGHNPNLLRGLAGSFLNAMQIGTGTS